MLHLVFLLLPFSLLIGLWVIVLPVTRMVEKLMVWPYAKDNTFAVPEWPLAEARPRVETRRAELEAAGFIPVQRGYDAKGKIYQVVYEFHVDQEQQRLSMIAHGRMLGIALYGTTMFSHGLSGTSYTTADNLSLLRKDWGSSWTSLLILPGTLDAMLARHAAFATQGDSLAAIDREDPLAWYRKLRAEQVDALARAGTIRYLGEDRNWYRYTFLGALRWTALSMGRGMVSTVKAQWKPLSAVFGLLLILRLINLLTHLVHH